MQDEEPMRLFKMKIFNWLYTGEEGGHKRDASVGLDITKRVYVNITQGRANVID